MGRTLAAILFLGLLAAGGWYAFGRNPEAPGGEGDPVDAPLHPEGGGPDPAAASGGNPAAPSALAPNAPSVPLRVPAERPGVSAAAAAADIRSQVQAGNAREAVARARALSDEDLREPAAATAAREAALALASGASSGPADRLARADEARRLLGRLAVAGAVPLGTLRDRLDALNREVLFSGREVPGTLFRGSVKPGDTLDRLMKREWKGRVRAGYGAVLWLNNLATPDRLRVGSVWVPEEAVRIVVRKKEHQLWVLLGEVPVRTFPVGLGMNGRTPEGTFEVEELMQRPDYWPPGGRRIPFGQKGNPLGTRWMGFRDTPEAQGYGIHGTDDPGSIGKDESQGCVRLRNEEVEQLFTWVTVGTKVEIRP
jgi:hypothetical protein